VREGAMEVVCSSCVCHLSSDILLGGITPRGQMIADTSCGVRHTQSATKELPTCSREICAGLADHAGARPQAHHPMLTSSLQCNPRPWHVKSWGRHFVGEAGIAPQPIPASLKMFLTFDHAKGKRHSVSRSPIGMPLSKMLTMILYDCYIWSVSESS
jgi:hypothetical protein